MNFIKHMRMAALSLTLTTLSCSGGLSMNIIRTSPDLYNYFSNTSDITTLIENLDSLNGCKKTSHNGKNICPVNLKIYCDQYPWGYNNKNLTYEDAEAFQELVYKKIDSKSKYYKMVDISIGLILVKDDPSLNRYACIEFSGENGIKSHTCKHFVNGTIIDFHQILIPYKGNVKFSLQEYEPGGPYQKGICTELPYAKSTWHGYFLGYKINPTEDNGRINFCAKQTFDRQKIQARDQIELDSQVTDLISKEGSISGEFIIRGQVKITGIDETRQRQGKKSEQITEYTVDFPHRLLVLTPTPHDRQCHETP